MSRWNVADVMTIAAVSVDQDTPFKQIVDLLTAHGVNAVPVVDGADHVLGLVSSADLIPKIEFAGTDEQAHLFEASRHRAARDKATGTAAAELMTAPAITVLARTSLVEAAKIMESEQLKRLPVVDDIGRLVGMVTRGDLLKVFLRDDADIRHEVTDEILTDIVGVDPGDMRVEVDDGVVTLLGQVSRDSLVPAITRHIERVSGVVDVVSYLTGRDDDADGRLGPARQTTIEFN